ncbi:hypothetical protein [Caulobacter soli]|uniref:hypothetical protein n=1 Tax=Caulobacter soli TaxID=2708539 RepID=UPI0013ED5269|nr:hypothetical protein [Caulobacter soli]
MTWGAIFVVWSWALGAWLYLMTLRDTPRSRTVLILGGALWFIAAPLELAWKAFEYFARRFLEKVLP